ncbi:GNAT family N-acetyltransferase [Asticcacaulis sp. BYS171W]|uniref:GNAT family N-acetyltransferase n=1 Tax=Asticcacaulis aquaticus TaxID=2984212 RepID=A0ABT5HVK9_9CAUL|nr:GNAT family N-acetyltransferase [Asticcacaulis aquaticus]
MHILDRPVWNALNTGWAHLALGSDRVRQLDPAFGPFAATADGTPEALSDLSPGPDGLWIVERDAMKPRGGLTVARTAPLHQMIAPAVPDFPPPDFDVVPLEATDGPEMLALAQLTKPGPFAERTHELSAFIGVRQDGRLAAMAGERMRVPGFAEISAVCTHPDFRGRGYAAGLMRRVMQRIAARGDVPFLHTYPDNDAAITLYKGLGFEYRVSMVATIFISE